MRHFFLCVLTVLYWTMMRLSGAVILFDIWRNHLGRSTTLGLLKPERGVGGGVGVFQLPVFILGVVMIGDIGCWIGDIFLQSPRLTPEVTICYSVQLPSLLLHARPLKIYPDLIQLI